MAQGSWLMAKGGQGRLMLDGPSEDAEVIFKMPKIKQDSPKIAFEKII